MTGTTLPSEPTTPRVRGVSVIICCHNSAQRIGPTVQCLASQRVASTLPWEVILVDNGSTDATTDVACKHWPQDGWAPLRVVREDHLGLSHARRRGFLEATFEYVSFIDDDNWVCDDWVETVASVFDARPNVGMCGGVGEAVFESEPPVWFKSYAESYAVGSQAPIAGYLKDGYLWGAGLSIRRSAWCDIFSAGFRSELSGRRGTALSSGEDTELCMALQLTGWEQWFEPRLKYRHYLPANRLQWRYLRRLYRGFGEASVGLEPYVFARQGRATATSQRIRQYWIWRFQAAIRDLFRRRHMFLHPSRLTLEGDREVLHLEHRLGRLTGFLRTACSYDDAVRRIRRTARISPTSSGPQLCER